MSKNKVINGVKEYVLPFKINQHSLRIDTNFCFSTIRTEGPYESEEDAIKALKKCLLVVDHIPMTYLMKDYNEEIDKYVIKTVNKAMAEDYLSEIVICEYEDVKTKKVKGNSVKEVVTVSLTALNIYKNNKNSFLVKGSKFYSENPQIFSVFRGYDRNLLKSINYEIIQPFLDHLLNIVCGNDKKCYEYFLDWMSFILQNPDGKTGVVPVLIGSPGSGKNITTDVFCNLLGIYANSNIANMSDVVGNFNSIIEGIKLAVLNEVKPVSSSRKVDFDVLKSLISEKMFTMNAKFEKQKVIQSYLNLIMISNHFIPIRIEGDDRRYFVLRIVSPHAPKSEYYTKLARLIYGRADAENTKYDTTAFYDNLYTMLIVRDISKVNLRDIPETEHKKLIKASSISVHEEFVRSCYVQINGSTSTEIYELFVAYCKTSGGNYMPGKPCFEMAHIKEFVEDPNPKASSIGGVKARRFRISKEWMKKIKENPLDTDLNVLPQLSNDDIICLLELENGRNDILKEFNITDEELDLELERRNIN